MLVVEYDSAKDAANLKKHGISLALAADFDFATAVTVLDDREDYGEERYRALGFLNAQLHALVFTVCDGALRAISLRSATRRETEEYADEF